MRLRRLDLSRYGGFTDRSIDLSGPGLHLVVGPNEAGKTTAMSAIRDLLFDFPRSSPQGYLHGLPSLRLGACVIDTEGNSHEIVRVKRDRDSLRDGDDVVRDPREFAGWMHGIDESLYRQLFSIGHDEIARGGQALLESDGDVAKAVFSAARGSNNLNEVVRTLVARAEEIYKPQGRNPPLNASMAEYKRAVAEVKQLSLRASSVTDLEERFVAACATRDRLMAERDEISRSRARYERIQAARPQFAEREDVIARRDALGIDVPVIDPVAETAFHHARELRQGARERARVARESIVVLDAEIATCVVDAQIQTHSEAIGQLQADLGAFRERSDDLPRRQAELHRAQLGVERLRQQVPSGCARDSREIPFVGAQTRARVTELADRAVRVDEQWSAAERERAIAHDRCESARREHAALDPPKDVRALEEVLARVQASSDIAAQCDAAQSQLSVLDGQLRVAVTQLGITMTDPRAIEGLPLPDEDHVQLMSSRLDEIGFAITRSHERRDAATAQIEHLERQRAGSAGAGDLPTDATLAQARAMRLEGWGLIQRVWRDGEDPSIAARWSDGLPIDERFRLVVAQADDIADRLRRDAAAIEQQTVIAQQIADARDTVEAERVAADALQRDLEEAYRQWQMLWDGCGVAAGTPIQMQRWRVRALDAARLSAQVGAHARHLETLIAHRTTLDEDLRGALGELGVATDPEQSYVARCAAGQRVRDDAQVHRDRYVKLVQSVEFAESAMAEADRRYTSAAAQRAAWRTEWADVVAEIGLSGSATVAEARAVIAAVSELATYAASCDDEIGRIAGIEERNAVFRARVSEMVAALSDHIDLVDRSVEVIIATLGQRREAMQQSATRYATLDAERERHRAEHNKAEIEIRSADATIRELCAQMAVDDEPALEEAVRRSREYVRTTDDIAAIDQRLRDAFGMSVEMLARDVAAADGQEIAPILDAFGDRHDEVIALLDATNAEVGDLSRQRQLVTISDDAARASDRAQNARADIFRLAEHYIQTVFARQILEDQIARYRASHQGPLLARAQQHFATLTLGKYARIDTDTSSDGVPVLFAAEPHGNRVGVASLSTGARDQLYLSLRLAALEHVIDRQGALPVILDDLFVHFDDQRTGAGLTVLDQISDQTQVILFTHHAHVADSARAAIAEDRLHISML